MIGVALLSLALASAMPADPTAPALGEVPVAEGVGIDRTRSPDSVRTPVLLVPGWSDEAGELEPLRARFLSAGWDPDRVAALDFRDPVGSNREHAREIGRAVDSLLTATGADSLHVVAHSMGGLALRSWLAGNPDAPVRRVAFLATPHRGTVAAHLAWGRGGREMEPGSPFLDSLNARPPVPSGVEALTVRTPLDLRVLPGESVTLPESERVRNVEICCPTHAGLLDHYETFRVLRRFLTEGPS